MSDTASKIDQIDARHETSEPHPSEALRTYWHIFYWLMALLVVTVVISRINLDRLLPGLNIVIALIIAFVKGALVVLFFMHVMRASKLTWLFATAAFAWLAILIALSFNDYALREDLRPTPRDTPAEYRDVTQEHEKGAAQQPVSPRDH